jgi:hypothetical protein
MNQQKRKKKHSMKKVGMEAVAQVIVSRRTTTCIGTKRREMGGG